MWFDFEISVIFHRFDARAMYRKSIKGLRNGSFFKDIKIIDRTKAKLKKKVFYDLSNVMLAFCCLDKQFNDQFDDLKIVVCSISVMAVVILIVAFLVMRRKRMDKDKSMFAYDNDDYDIREDVMDYDEDGAGWCF